MKKNLILIVLMSLAMTAVANAQSATDGSKTWLCDEGDYTIKVIPNGSKLLFDVCEFSGCPNAPTQPATLTASTISASIYSADDARCGSSAVELDYDGQNTLQEAQVLCDGHVVNDFTDCHLVK